VELWADRSSITSAIAGHGVAELSAPKHNLNLSFPAYSPHIAGFPIFSFTLGLDEVGGWSARPDMLAICASTPKTKLANGTP